MADTKTNYRNLSSELDEILAKLQSSDLDIDEALKLYERGLNVAKQLEKYLKTAENKITKIKSNLESKSKA